ncbi:MAK10-like protein [Tanacetum coccineum]
MGDANHICTLIAYSKPSHEGYRNTIELPIGNNVIPLQSDTIRLVQNGERTRLRLFQFSLRDQARNWLERLPVGSITTWEDLTTRFLAQFFPSRRTAKLCNDILMFQKHQGESLSEAWTLWTYYKKSLIMASTFGSKNAKESYALLEDLAFYNNKSWNGPRDFAKPVKAISLPQDVPSTSDRRLIELKNQVQCLMEAHLAPTQPTQVNKITTSCEICSGPHDTQYCMEDPEQAFVEYASSRTDEAGDARLSKFEADFKQQQSEMTNKIDTVLKAITDRIAGALPSDTQQSDSHDDEPAESEEEEKDSPEKTNTNPSASPDPSVSFITEKIVKKNDDSRKEGLEVGGLEVEYFDIFPTRSKLAYHKYLMCGPIPSIFLRNPIITEEWNFTYVTEFMIVEDISSIIDPRLSQVVLGKPFIEISNMTHDPLEGVVNLEKEHTKSVYLSNEEDKRKGVEYVMSKILEFYKECLELGPEYVTGMDDEGEVTAMIDQGVTAILAARDANTNGVDSHNSGTCARINERATHDMGSDCLELLLELLDVVLRCLGDTQSCQILPEEDSKLHKMCVSHSCWRSYRLLDPQGSCWTEHEGTALDANVPYVQALIPCLIETRASFVKLTSSDGHTTPTPLPYDVCYQRLDPDPVIRGFDWRCIYFPIHATTYTIPSLY